MKEIATIKNNGKTNKVVYDFETNILQGQNQSFNKPMTLAEYKKVKSKTIKQAKENGWNLEFEKVI